MRIRPYVERRAAAESSFVSGEGCCVLVVKVIALHRATLRRSVVKIAFKHLGAESLPVIAGVSQVEVPSLIDRKRRRDIVPGSHGVIATALIFADHPFGMGHAPAVFPCEPCGEGERAVVQPDGVSRDAVP